jgi:hypothetical protein
LESSDSIFGLAFFSRIRQDRSGEIGFDRSDVAAVFHVEGNVPGFSAEVSLF